jgi:hypothetical protein
LSEIVPTAAIARCKELLLENGVAPSSKLDTYTVKSFIQKDFNRMIGYAAWKSNSAKHVREISQSVVDATQKALYAERKRFQADLPLKADLCRAIWTELHNGSRCKYPAAVVTYLAAEGMVNPDDLCAMANVPDMVKELCSLLKTAWGLRVRENFEKLAALE